MTKSLLKRLGFLVGLLVVTVLARFIITGGYPTIKLSSASALAGPVSIGIGQGSSDTLPVEGKDYRIKSAEFFDDKEWAVVRILPLKNKADPAILVLKKIDGVYQAVLGPSGQFSSGYFYVMPFDVSQYLTQQEAFR